MTQFVYLPKRQILQRVVFNNLLRQYSFYQNSKDFRKPIKTVSIDSPADLDRTTTQGLGKANPMVEVIIFFLYPKNIQEFNLGLYTKEEQPTVQECTTCIGWQAFKHASRQVAIVQTCCFLGTRLCNTKKIGCHSSFSLPTKDIPNVLLSHVYIKCTYLTAQYNL